MSKEVSFCVQRGVDSRTLELNMAFLITSSLVVMLCTSGACERFCIEGELFERTNRCCEQDILHAPITVVCAHLADVFYTELSGL